MTTLLPGFDDQLALRAEALARRSRRPWRRWHGAGAVLIAVVSVSGVAYASKGLWSPPLGDDLRGHPTATASDVPAEQLARFGVLRREQTERDRGAASLYALSFQSKSVGSIRTNAVRRVDRAADAGHAVVLIPVLRKPSKSGAPSKSRDQLCLWLRDPADGGGQSCASTADAIAGKLSMAMLPQPELTPAQRERLMRYMKRARAEAKRKGSNSVMIPGEIHSPPGSERPGKMVGLVPDGVASVRVGTGKDRVTVQVVDNVFVAPVMEGSIEGDPDWLTADGKRYPALRAKVVTGGIALPPWAYEADAKAKARARAVSPGG